MALSDFTGPDYIGAWTEDLDRRWPERSAMADCVVRTLVGWRGEWHSGRRAAVDGERTPEAHPGATIRLLELGVGAGGLARSVLDALAKSVATGTGASRTIEYTGIEIEPALVLYVNKLLEESGFEAARVIRADLRSDAWAHGLGPFDVIFTLQTLHDLGGVDALEAVYRRAHGLLAPAGILVNADFVVPFGKDDPARPRRLPVETHEHLLSSLGFIDFRCELRHGKMACLSARRP